MSKTETVKEPIKRSSTEASPVQNMSKMETGKALQDYLECTNTQDLAAALESISKHGSCEAAIQAFFRDAHEETLPTASANVDGLSSSHMDRLLNAPQLSGAPIGTASFQPFSKDLMQMASKDDVLHTMEAERNCLANRVYQERYPSETTTTPGLYMQMQADSKLNRIARKSKEEVNELERSKRAAANILGPAQMPHALLLLQSKNGTEEKGKSKRMKGQQVDGHAGDPGSKDFPESDRIAYQQAVSKVLLGEDVTMIGEMMSKGKRAYYADGSNTMILLGTNGMSHYEDKFLSTDHYFKAGTDNEAGNLQTGWVQKKLFLQVGGTKVIASTPNPNPITLLP